MQDQQPIPLRVSQLCKSFGGTQVLNGISFSVTPAAVHGLVGLNGAGKSTTLAAVLGLLPFDSGDVAVLGVPPTRLYQLAGKVAVVFDEPCLPGNLTVRETLQLAAMTAGGKSGTELDKLQALLGISRYACYKLRDLSLGNRRRTAIAQALVGDPALIVMDEPFNGLDAGGVDDVLALIQQLNRQRGISFLLASHQLSYLQQVCTHMSFVHEGKIALSDSLEQLLSAAGTRVLLKLDQAVSLPTITGFSVISHDERGNVVGDLDGISSAELNRQLVAQGLAVHELLLQRETLEDKFRELLDTPSNVSGQRKEAAHA